MPIRITRFPPLGVLALGIFTGILIAFLLVFPKMEGTTERYRQNYGNALATMAANQAIDATFNHDLVRLQVILRDIMENPQTALATIHDVENNLLVQAGEARRGDTRQTSFTAPIVLHDSIAGYLTVNLENDPDALQPLLLMLLLIELLLLAIAFWSFREAGGIQFSVDFRQWLPGNTSRGDREQTPPEEPPEEEPLEVEETPEVYAVIHIKNLAVLTQQLNSETYNITLSRMEKVMSDVMALYGGSGYEFRDNYYILFFNANDATNEALFRATCSAHLIVELASIINNIPLDLAAFVSANKDDVTPASLPIAGLILEEHAASDELIQRRLQFMEVGTDDGRLVVAGFEQPFQTLLDNQCRQLSQLI